MCVTSWLPVMYGGTRYVLLHGYLSCMEGLGVCYFMDTCHVWEGLGVCYFMDTCHVWRD